MMPPGTILALVVFLAPGTMPGPSGDDAPRHLVSEARRAEKEGRLDDALSSYRRLLKTRGLPPQEAARLRADCARLLQRKGETR
ncbi:MAG TPA: hypothetical protein EYP62_05360, partial [Kiritimatiellae bacterium]|nr:hypothetical protein [Kiritimatiellia bacterium]